MNPTSARTSVLDETRAIRLLGSGSWSLAGPCLCLALVVSVALRFYRLTGDSLWVDEAFSAWLVRQPFGAMWRLMALENHPPLYYLLLRAWAALFGPGDFAVRALSALCSVLTVAAVAGIAWRIWGVRTAALAASLAAVSPPLVRYGQEARMYAPAALFCTLALGGALLWLAGRRHGVFYAATMTLALYTHYYAVFFWVATTLAISYLLLVEHRDAEVLRWLAWCAVPPVAFLAWLPMFIAQWHANWGTHWLLNLPAPTAQSVADVVAWCFGLRIPSLAVQFAWGPTPAGPSLAFLAGGVAWAWLALGHGHPLVKEQTGGSGRLALSATAGVLFGTFGLSWGISQWHQMWLPRYLLVAMPGLVLLTAGLLARLRPAALAVPLAGLLLASAALATSRTVGTMGPENREPWREVARQVRVQWQPGDMVVVPEPPFLPPTHVCLTHYGVPPSEILAVTQDLSRPTDRARLDGIVRSVGRIWLVDRLGRGTAVEEYLRAATRDAHVQVLDLLRKRQSASSWL